MDKKEKYQSLTKKEKEKEKEAANSAPHHKKSVIVLKFISSIITTS